MLFIGGLFLKKTEEKDISMAKNKYVSRRGSFRV